MGQMRITRNLFRGGGGRRGEFCFMKDADQPMAVLLPVITVSASTIAICGVKKRMLRTVSVRFEALRLPLKRDANQASISVRPWRCTPRMFVKSASSAKVIAVACA